MKKVKSLFCTIIFMSIIATFMSIKVQAAGKNYATASEIVVNNSITDNLSEKGEWDYYKFSIPQNGVVSVQLSHILNDEGSWDVTLQNSDYKEICEFYSYWNNESVKSCDIGLPQGTYYLIVKEKFATSYSNIDYSVLINYVSSDDWETEFNNDFVYADEYILGKKLNGSLVQSADDDYYKFNVDVAGYYNVSFYHEAVEQGDWEIRLYDGNNNRFETFDSDRLNTEVNRFVYLNAGTNYIHILTQPLEKSSNSNYSFEIDPLNLPKVKIKKVSNPKKKQLKVLWQNANTNGYEINIALNKKFTKKLRTLNVSFNKTNYSIKKLTTKKIYYVRVRAYNVDSKGSKVYGKWSAVKKIKIKK